VPCSSQPRLLPHGTFANREKTVEGEISPHKHFSLGKCRAVGNPELENEFPNSRLLPANIFNLFFKRGFSEKCYSFSVGFLFHEEGSPLPAKIF
jgi:hypothetical protein